MPNSHGTDAGLFSGLFAHGQAASLLSDRAFVEAMVEVEAALPGALADLGLAPPQAARELLTGLQVDPEKMRADMYLTGGLVMSESVAAALAPPLGRARAQSLVEQAARGVVEGYGSFRYGLLNESDVDEALGEEGLDAALDPAGYLGVTTQLIDRALEAHRAG